MKRFLNADDSDFGEGILEILEILEIGGFDSIIVLHPR